MNKIPFKMIELTLDSGEKVNLSSLLENSYDIPIYYLSGGEYSKNTINTAINYLKSKGGGSFTVPPTPKYHKLRVDVHKNKTGNLIVQYIYSDYRFPINTETRPYTGDDWQPGDIILNLDITNSDDKSYLWFCQTGGKPGNWRSTAVFPFSNDEVLSFINVVSEDIIKKAELNATNLVNAAAASANAAAASANAAAASAKASGDEKSATDEIYYKTKIIYGHIFSNIVGPSAAAMTASRILVCAGAAAMAERG